MFVQPLYCGVLLEQSLMLNRRRDDKDRDVRLGSEKVTRTPNQSLHFSNRILLLCITDFDLSFLLTWYDISCSKSALGLNRRRWIWKMWTVEYFQVVDPSKLITPRWSTFVQPCGTRRQKKWSRYWRHYSGTVEDTIE